MDCIDKEIEMKSFNSYIEILGHGKCEIQNCMFFYFHNPILARSIKKALNVKMLEISNIFNAKLSLINEKIKKINTENIRSIIVSDFKDRTILIKSDVHAKLKTYSSSKGISLGDCASKVLESFLIHKKFKVKVDKGSPFKT
jgi:hypothetical protein